MNYITLDDAIKNRISFCYQDIYDILTAEGYWSPIDRIPTAAGLAVTTRIGRKFYWEKDFVQGILKKYSMNAYLFPYLKEFLEAQVYCHQVRLYPSMFSIEEQNTWQDRVPIISADLIIRIRIWGLNRNTTLKNNLSRFNRWLRRTASKYGFEQHVTYIQRHSGGRPRKHRRSATTDYAKKISNRQPLSAIDKKPASLSKL